MKNIFLLLMCLIGFSSSICAASFVVNNNGDTTDSNTSDTICADTNGNCTLRAAIQQANALNDDDIITFAFTQPATINLTLGDLRITSNLTILGIGARNLTIQRSLAEGTANFRIFTLLNNDPIVAAGTINISGVTIMGGSTEQCGGGIFISFNLLTVNLTEVAIKNNSSTSVFTGSTGGGGICTEGRSLNITRSTVSNNNTDNTGGGIRSTASVYTPVININNSTISDNSSNRSGGGIENGGKAILNNVTISNNYGGGVFGSVLQIRNTIVANNPPILNGGFFDVYAPSTISLGNNLIGNNRGAESSFPAGNPNANKDKVGNSTNPLNPLLGALQNNGGQTDTRALLIGSPAIDSGNNCVVTATCPSDNSPAPLVTDQRGYIRLIGANVDIGAFELQGVTAASVSVSGKVLNSNGRGISKATIILTNSNGESRFAITNPFGYYRFADVAVGNTYVLNVLAKKYDFSPKVFAVNDEETELNLTANP